MGKEATAAIASYRGRDATARCREGGVVFADVGKVVITAAWCRGRDAAAGCRRGDVAGKAMPMW